MNQAASSQVAPARNFGKYRVVAKLGEGGMADVYLGLATGIAGFNKLLVIKRLREEQFDTDEGVKMFVDEARLSALLNHPNVVQTYEVYQQGATYFTVMEYLEGQSLHSVLHYVRKQRGTLTIPMVVRIACEVLSGLHYAHELRHPDGRALGVVHRDVTPHNIFVTYDGVIKLVDFGVAKAATASSATQAGAIKGKVAYLAPEQVKSPDKVDRRADIFQLGIVLFEGLTGRRYWEGEKQYNIFKRLFSDELPDFPEDTEVPAALIDICRKALAASPDQRFETAAQFRRELESYLDTERCNVTPRHVGEHVAEMFAQRRAETRSLIETAIRELESEPSAASPDAVQFPTIEVPMLQSAWDPRASSPSFGSGPQPIANTFDARSSSPSFDSGPQYVAGNFGSGPHSAPGSYGSGPHSASGSYPQSGSGQMAMYGSQGAIAPPAPPASVRFRTLGIIAGAGSIAFLAAALLFGKRTTPASAETRAAAGDPPASTAPVASAPAPLPPPSPVDTADAAAADSTEAGASTSKVPVAGWRVPPGPYKKTTKGPESPASTAAPASTPAPAATPAKKRERDIE